MTPDQQPPKRPVHHPVTDDIVWCSDCHDNHLPGQHSSPPEDAVAFPPIQFEAATPVVTSLPIPGVQRTGVVGIATCLTCGAVVMTSSGEAMDLHHAWHAEQSRTAQPDPPLSAPTAQPSSEEGSGRG